MASRPRWAAIVLLLLAAGCTSSDPSAPLCQFGVTPSETTLISYRDAYPHATGPGRVSYSDRAGPVIRSDIDVAAYREEVAGSIASAIAKPNREVYVAERRKDCFDQAGGYYYPCYERIEIDLREVTGIGRSPNLNDAQELAVANCEWVAKTLARNAAEVRGLVFALQCHVVSRGRCSLD